MGQDALMNADSPLQATETIPAAKAGDPALERLLYRVRLRAERRVAWLRKLWNEEEAPGGALGITHGEVDTYLRDKDAPAAEAQWIGSDPAAKELTAELSRLETEMDQDRESCLSRLQQIFSLSDEETDALHACLGSLLDPALRRVYGYLQDRADRCYATEELIGRLFGYGRKSIIPAGSPLIAWRLIAVQKASAGEPRVLECDRAVGHWLSGRTEIETRLRRVARIVPPLSPLENWPVSETAGFLASLIEDGVATRTSIVGPMGSGRRTLAAAIAAELDRPLVAIDSDAIDDDWTEVFIRARRHALLNNCALAWFGERATERPWPKTEAPRVPVQFVICDPMQRPAPLPDTAEHYLEMPPTSHEERRRLWHRYVPASLGWDEADSEALFDRSGVTVNAIVEAGRSAVQTPEAAAAKVRETARRGFGDLIEVLECPFEWDDLIVPDQVRRALEDFVFEAHARGEFWEDAHRRRLFPQGRGLFALLAGAPGVGKTMIAQVVARALRRELYRIDVSRVVSKWVGETASNLRRLLSSVPTDEVLLFDEADALFGKRPSDTRDAHDRYAVQESSTLLMAIEGAVEGGGSFGPGSIGLLATNRKGEIDTAFIRRLRYVIDVPRPDAERRLKLWQRLLCELVGEDSLASLAAGLEPLSREVEVTGAQIKFAILSAIFVAAKEEKPLDSEHLLYGLERELGKEGRGLSRRERNRLQGVG